MKKEYKNVKLSDLKPYENNPRYNEPAVEPVKASIEQVGYISPIVVDEDMVVLSGHTRLKSLQALGEDSADVIVVTGLNEEKKRKFRLLDNKTGEFAIWDWNKLEKELEGLSFDDFDFGFPDSLDSQFDDIMSYVPEGDRDYEPDTFQMTLIIDKTYEDDIKDYIRENGKEALVELIIAEIIND